MISIENRRFLTMWTLLAGFCAMAGALRVSAQTEMENVACVPDCRDGYLCHRGICVSACNPPCNDLEVCTREGHCVPKSPPIQSAPAPVTGSGAMVPSSQIPPYPHSKGLGARIAGSILMGIGILNLATSPICFSGMVGQDDVCFIASMIVGGTALSIGIPLLISGRVKKRRYLRWKEQYTASPGLRLVGSAQFSGLVYHSEF